ncbi:hypothetical protein RHGRI_031235 [Rhododendron griersonianum]|uniref:Uncharacterized protein n=1 Tax=Rhododendron griersonianum TaxID=479676 RepID=A0AAV6I744_9ERIC|nr:hypothetical protein RHGRI_031235 [Rhododendron griersonianum]
MRGEFNGKLQASVLFLRENVGHRSWIVVSFDGPLNQLNVNKHLQGPLRVAGGLKADLNDLRSMVKTVAAKFVKPPPRGSSIFQHRGVCTASSVGASTIAGSSAQGDE